MDIFTALIVFAVSLFALVKGADYLIQGAERIGRFYGMPSFVIGALIVGVGTSLPEVASSFAALFAGEDQIVVANAVGSNIANVLLVIGLSAVVGRQIVSTKNLTDIEVPLLVSATALFIGTAYDGVVTQVEAIILFLGFLIYLSYLLIHPDESGDNEDDLELKVKKIVARDFMMLIGGGVALMLGANYLINSVIEFATIFGVSTGIIAISAVAVGTSLPEILVSITAVLRGKTDMAIGNVFGSNIFNILLMVGLVGMFSDLSLDEQTFTIGLPFLGAITVLFMVSALSKRIHIWEGLFYLVIYLFFMLKIFGF